MYKELETIPLLNVDIKNISEAISSKVKSVLPTLVFSQERAYVENRFNRESCRQISDIIGISGWFDTDRFLVTLNIEKVFDSF